VSKNSTYKQNTQNKYFIYTSNHLYKIKITIPCSLLNYWQRKVRTNQTE